MTNRGTYGKLPVQRWMNKRDNGDGGWVETDKDKVKSKLPHTENETHYWNTVWHTLIVYFELEYGHGNYLL